MKILFITAAALGVVCALGATQEVRAVIIQPVGLATQQDHFLLTGHGHGHKHGHGHGHGHRHGHHHHWGGSYWGPGTSYYYNPPVYRRACYVDGFGYVHCHRRHYY